MTSQRKCAIHFSTGSGTEPSSSAYTYNAESELVAAAGFTYVYDGDGHRVEKVYGGSVVKIYWYGGGSSALDETDGTGNTANNSFNEYIFVGGARIARRDGSGDVFYYVSDHVGTSRAIAEVPSGQNSATLCYDADFYPFGGEMAFTNSCSQNYKFEGHERDAESGLDDFGARFYNSGSVLATTPFGRFTSADWSAVPTPVPYANLTNPQTLNLYAIVSDNPETFADLTGHARSLPPPGNPPGEGLPSPMGGSCTLDGISVACSFIAYFGNAVENPDDAAAEQAAQNQANRQQAAQQQNTSTVVVEQVKGEGVNVLGHVAISINGGAAVGLVPDSDKAAAKALAKEVASAANGTPEASPVPGHVEALAKGRKIDGHATIHVTPQQAAAMQAAIKGMAGHQVYDPAYRNCASFVEEVLRSGGVKAPNDITPGGLVGDLNKQFPQ